MVKRDEPVKRGQIIAKAGQTGNVAAPQLHFEIRKGSTPVDPMPLPRQGRPRRPLGIATTPGDERLSSALAPSCDDEAGYPGNSGAEPARHFLDELPGDAARARAPRVTDHSSASRAAPPVDRHAEMVGIALDHGEDTRPGCSGGSRATGRSDPTARPSPRPPRRIDRRRALVLDHVARHQMAAVRRGIEHHVLRPALDAAFEHRLQRLVGGVLAVEGEVVAEHDEAARRIADLRAAPAGADVLAMDLDQRQRPGGPPRSRFTWAWTAFTIELLPTPREPHSSALLAGRPLAKRRVFSSRVSFCRSMPISRSRLTRLTLAPPPAGGRRRARR